MKRVWLCGRQTGTVFATQPTQLYRTHPYHPHTHISFLSLRLSLKVSPFSLALPSPLRSDELVKLALIMQACLKPQKLEMESE